MTEKLSHFDIVKQLADLPDWSLADGKLHRSLKFKDFVQAFAFMTAGALEAEKMNHHPDWSNSYSLVEIDLHSHDIGGISERDFRLAKKLESRAAVFLSGN